MEKSGIETGLTTNARRRWTQQEEAVVAARYMTDPASEIAKVLGRTEYAVRNKAGALGMRNLKGGVNIWESWEDQYVIDHYADDSAEDIAQVLGRTVYAVIGRASRLQVANGAGSEIPLALQRVFRGWEKKHCFGPVTA